MVAQAKDQTKAQAQAQTRVALVCLGNICRSPMADVVLRGRLLDAGLADEIEVVSAGTGNWHVGNPMDPRAAATLQQSGYDPSLHRAQQFGPHWFHDCDLILAMDRDNLSDVLLMAETDDERNRVRMFRDFDPEANAEDRDVPDPYYGGDHGFGQVLSIIERTADTLVADLRARVGG